MVDKYENNNINTHDDDNEILPAGMLSSPQIQYCIEKYSIIKHSIPESLGPASYHMRIGGDVLAWEQGQKIEFNLDEKDDYNRNIRSKLEFKPNSLTFVTTIEEFNLTKDIIARFNLKSKLVHEGLLLGTGPIVDPQLKARLLIPIHNFSNTIVSMNYADEIISVEFTKTSNPNPKQEYTLKNGKKAEFKENDHWDFNFKKYRKRIADKKVASSVKSQFEKFEQILKENEKVLEKTTSETKDLIDKSERTKQELISRQNRWNLGGLIAVIIAIAGLFIMSYQLWDSVDSKAVDAYKLVKEFENNSIDYRSFALKTNVAELQNQIISLSKSVMYLSESNLAIKKETSKLKVEKDILEQKIKEVTSYRKALISK